MSNIGTSWKHEKTFQGAIMSVFYCVEKNILIFGDSDGSISVVDYATKNTINSISPTIVNVGGMLQDTSEFLPISIDTDYKVYGNIIKFIFNNYLGNVWLVMIDENNKLSYKLLSTMGPYNRANIISDGWLLTGNTVSRISIDGTYIVFDADEVGIDSFKLAEPINDQSMIISSHGGTAFIYDIDSNNLNMINSARMDAFKIFGKSLLISSNNGEYFNDLADELVWTVYNTNELLNDSISNVYEFPFSKANNKEYPYPSIIVSQPNKTSVLVQKSENELYLLHSIDNKIYYHSIETPIKLESNEVINGVMLDNNPNELDILINVVYFDPSNSKYSTTKIYSRKFEL